MRCLLILLLFISSPGMVWAATDIFSVQARGFQLGMSYDEANTHAEGRLADRLVDKTEDFLLYKPDTRGLAGYDLSLWFSNTPRPKLYELTLHRRFSSLLDTDILAKAYEEKFGRADDNCSHTGKDAVYSFLAWGGAIERCGLPDELSVSASSFIVVTIKRVAEAKITDVTLHLRSYDIFDQAMMAAAELKNPAKPEAKLETKLEVKTEIEAAEITPEPAVETASVENRSAEPTPVPTAPCKPERTVAEASKAKPLTVQPEAVSIDSKPLEQAVKDEYAPTIRPVASRPDDAEREMEYNLAAAASEPVAATAPKVQPRQAEAARPSAKGGHVVQLASFKETEMAKEEAQRLNQRGLGVSVVLLYNSKGQAWHVLQVGPFATAKQAVEEAARIKGSYKIDGMVKSLDPTLLAERTYFRPDSGNTGGTGGVELAKTSSEVQESSWTIEAPAQSSNQSPAPVAAPAQQAARTDDSKTQASPVADGEATRYSVQIGAFLKADRAKQVADLYGRKGYPTAILKLIDSKQRTWHTVHIGAYPGYSQAMAAAKNFQSRENKTYSIGELSEKLIASRMYYENYGNSLLDNETTKHVVQIASCRDLDSAKAVVRKFAKRGYSPSVLKLYDSKQQVWHVVEIGEYLDASAAEHAARQFQERWGTDVVVTALKEKILLSRRIDT